MDNGKLKLQLTDSGNFNVLEPGAYGEPNVIGNIWYWTDKGWIFHPALSDLESPRIQLEPSQKTQVEAILRALNI